MAKSKNHTNHNQNQKAHKNGIKRPARNRHESSIGMDAKFVRNLRFSKKGNVTRDEADKRAKENKDKKRQSIKL
ncbi:CLUMA_CG009852, isoform A [Clunio marinus]|uniref:60S ribosomal protein L29 n=1 Tax=Clunio marinus TaxID=568069 RepID=A0A1J1IA40_9DIPT|nr:CLUMA_CG009852, isoform A [Clunio marinus]